MEVLAIGDKINIRRSDGCIQAASVGLKSPDRQVVTVEWTQGSKVKGKEIPWGTILELNPFLAKFRQKQQSPPDKMEPPKAESKPHNLSGYSMYRKKSTNSSPYKKRMRNRCDSTVNVPASIKTAKPAKPVKPVKSPAIRAVHHANPVNAEPRGVRGASSTASIKRSSVVREVERLKEQRERRRAWQAEQRREQSVLMSKDPGNPNWEVALMVRNYRGQLHMNPLRCLSSRGARTQQITVCVRKRPMSRRELQSKAVDIISVPSRSSLIVHELRNKVDLTKFLEHHKFRFDYTFDEQCSNALVYEHTARPLIRTMFEGGNATCFAYGQTGSGKTHTMGGEFCGKVQDCTTGIYALAAQDVFAELEKPKYREMGASVTCSYFEIYGSKVFDLLLPEKPMLRVLEDGRQQVVIVGLTRMPVQKVEDVLAIIEQGNRERTSGQTSVNIKSSRSHAVFQMGLVLPDDTEPCGKCSFVDLAGNERGADTQSANLQTRREGAEINKSLLALKECIRALSRHSSHLPFRGSKLTQVLRDSFIGGEQNKTCMIAMISPGLSSVENTLNTLRYADRVKELVAKDDDLVETDSEQPSKNDETSSANEDSKPGQESGTETDTESDEFETEVNDERANFAEFNSSQNSDATSSFRKFDSNMSLSDADGEINGEPGARLQISEILMQHEVMFEFFNNYKMHFEAAVRDETSLEKNKRITKFLLNGEPIICELAILVKHAHDLISNYNSQRFSESDLAESDEVQQLSD
ncbi:PREDICTED: kinesin-like protein Klp59C [Drosophila arizonae]|uniref:Kinesin-like protein Klp59C n=1 Tax=Drosophila arizonae TaxID=7263 RepID=A0ABM1NXZ1_DROAR|nr:PREDICTED: kinesin-like protein Klp59C [Drosophila arizonae]